MSPSSISNTKSGLRPAGRRPGVIAPVRVLAPCAAIIDKTATYGQSTFFGWRSLIPAFELRGAFIQPVSVGTTAHRLFLGVDDKSRKELGNPVQSFLIFRRIDFLHHEPTSSAASWSNCLASSTHASASLPYPSAPISSANSWVTGAPPTMIITSSRTSSSMNASMVVPI